MLMYSWLVSIENGFNTVWYLLWRELFVLGLLIWNYWLSPYHHMGVLKMKATWREAEPRRGKRKSLITSFQGHLILDVSLDFSVKASDTCAFFVKVSLSLELVSFAIYRVPINTEWQTLLVTSSEPSSSPSSLPLSTLKASWSLIYFISDISQIFHFSPSLSSTLVQAAILSYLDFMPGLLTPV